MTEENVQVAEYRKVFWQAVQARMVEAAVYMGMPNEEWAVKIMVNVLLNTGADTGMDE